MRESREGTGAMLLSDETVSLVSDCDLRIADEPWPFARQHGSDIERAWSERIASNPAFFNGTVHLLRAGAIEDRPSGHVFAGHMWASDFKSFVHWRGLGYPPAEAFDCFGSAIIRSVEGHILLGRQRDGINAGLTYLPGGFIDHRDVAADGRIDIVGNVMRELQEETGLDPATLESVPGYLVTRAGPLVSVGVMVSSRMAADDLHQTILSTLANDPEPELADIVVVREPADLKPQRVPRYTALVVAHLLGPSPPD